MSVLVEEYVAIRNKKDLAALPRVFSKEAVYSDSIQHGNAIEVLEELIGEVNEAFSDLSFEILGLSSSDDKKLQTLDWIMRGKNTGTFLGFEPTNKKLEITGTDIVVIHGEKIGFLTSYYDSSLFLTQLGI